MIISLRTGTGTLTIQKNQQPPRVNPPTKNKTCGTIALGEILVMTDSNVHHSQLFLSSQQCYFRFIPELEALSTIHHHNIISFARSRK